MSFLIRTAAVASVCSLAGISGASAQPETPVESGESQLARRAALINAEASLVEAQNRMATARLGAIPQAPQPGGSVQMGQNAGLAESAILTTRALSQAATLVAADVHTGGAGKPDTVFILTQAELLSSMNDLREWRRYAAKYDAVRDAFAVAHREKSDLAGRIPVELGEALDPLLQPSLPVTKSSPVLASISGLMTGLNVVSQVGSYFQTDYTIAGAKADGDQDALIRTSLVGALGANRDVFIGPDSLNTPGARRSVKEQLDALYQAAVEAKGDVETIEKWKAAYDRAAASNSPSNATYKRISSLLDEAVGRSEMAIDAYNSLIKEIDAGALGDKAPYFAIVRQTAINELAQDSNPSFVVVHVDSSQWATLTENSLWTFLGGGAPVSVAVSTVVTSQVVDPSTGMTKSAGTIVCDSGYVRMNEIHQSNRSGSGRGLVHCQKLAK